MPNDLQLEVTSTTPDLELALTDYVGSAYSPQVEVEDIEGGHNVSITHKGPDGLVTDSFDVMDGVSPTVDITSTTERHTITITDAQGPHVYEVDTYAEEERARATAESGRASAESARVSAESARAIAERGRSTAESARDEAESVRSAEEATRAENEGTRVTNETARANAEIARDAAEQAREQAETNREAAWVTLSEQATSATQAASNAAQTASQAASAAYSAAQSASQAESTMTANETARASAEQGRVAAEQGRVTAEQSRVSAETTRATEWAEIKGEAQNATTAAQSATQAATDAAALATRAAAATWNEGNVPYGSLTGTVLTADDAWSAPAKSVGVHGKSVQDGTPTPDAPVPIKSVDDLTLVFAGKNLLDAANPAISNYATYTYENDTLTVTAGRANTWCYQRYRVPAVEWMQGQSITLSAIVSATGTPYFGIEFYRADDSRITYTLSNTQAITKTVPSDTSYISILFYARNTAAGAVGDTATYRNVQLELGSTATAYAPYVGQSVTIPLGNNVGRSLPDGTRDSLTLSYIGPSTREGWGVFGKTLVQNVGEVVVDGSESWISGSVTCDGALATTRYHWFTEFASFSVVDTRTLMSNKFPYEHGLIWATPDNYVDTFRTYSRQLLFCISNERLGVTDESTSNERSTAFKAWLAQNPVTVIYQLAEPITHDLGTVELPVNPAPDLTAWADGGSAQPTLSMEYEQDINIVVNELRNLIADMVTS